MFNGNYAISYGLLYTLYSGPTWPNLSHIYVLSTLLTCWLLINNQPRVDIEVSMSFTTELVPNPEFIGIIAVSI